MRGYLIALLGQGIVLLSSSPLCAGVYSTLEPMAGPVISEDGVEALGFSQFQDIVSTIIATGIEPPAGSKLSATAQRKHYLAARDELEAKSRAGRITTTERINLSAYLIGLRQYNEAAQILDSVAAQKRDNFMLYANLATALQLAGHLDRALGYLQQVKVPQSWAGLTSRQLQWFQAVEKYQLELVKLRYRELARLPTGRSQTPEKLDDLFRGDKGPVHFVGEEGRYEAGKLARAERAKLPPDALAIVQQLVIWFPDDTRLYWLLGEIYNANGDIEAAARIFDECVGNVRRFSAPDLRAHRLVVQEAKPKAESIVLDTAASRSGAANAPVSGSSPSWLPNGRQLMAVGGVAGLAVIVLVYFQVREMRRRRNA